MNRRIGGRKKKKKSILLRLALLAFAAYSIYHIAAYQVRLFDMRQQLDQLAAEGDSRQLRLSELEALLNSEDNSELVEFAARDRLGYVFTNEIVIIDVN